MSFKFSNLVFSLSKMLSKEDLEAIAYLYRLPLDAITSGSGTNGLHYLRELEKRDIFSLANLRGLKDFLNTIQRSDLVEMVEEFEKDRQRHSQEEQRKSRPQEERVRLDTSYAQAKKIEQQLREFRKEFTAFCSRLGNSPSLRTFCSGMLRRLKTMQDSCHQFIIQPLHEIMHYTYLPPTHNVSTKVQSSTNCSGSRECDSQTDLRTGGDVVVTDGNPTVVARTVQCQKKNNVTEHSHCQKNKSTPPMQTATPLRTVLATSAHGLIKQTHSSSSSSVTRPKVSTEYDVLSPIVIDNEPTNQRDGIRLCVFPTDTKSSKLDQRGTSMANLHSVQSKSTSKNGSQSKTRQHNSLEKMSHGMGKLRTSNSSSSATVSNLQVPLSTNLKRFSSEDSLLGPVPSRIPKLHQLYQHSDRRLTSQRDRDSFEMSVTSSDYDRDFTASNDSGIEIRDMKTCCIRRPQNSPDMTVRPLKPKTKSNGDQKYMLN